MSIIDLTTLLQVVSTTAVVVGAYQEANEGKERTGAHHYGLWLTRVRIQSIDEGSWILRAVFL